MSLGWGVGMLTFMLTCVTCTSNVTSLGFWGVGMLTFMLTCVTCTSNVTSLGAPCYPSLSHKFGWRHEACNHSKGLFCVKKRISNKTVMIHTGGVDAMWRLSKSAIPCSLPTRSNGHVNPKLMRSIRVWQWRWMNSTTKGLMEVTGQALKNRMAM